jgi:hypothetical protein
MAWHATAAFIYPMSQSDHWWQQMLSGIGFESLFSGKKTCKTTARYYIYRL